MFKEFKGRFIKSWKRKLSPLLLVNGAQDNFQAANSRCGAFVYDVRRWMTRVLTVATKLCTIWFPVCHRAGCASQRSTVSRNFQNKSENQERFLWVFLDTEPVLLSASHKHTHTARKQDRGNAPLQLNVIFMTKTNTNHACVCFALCVLCSPAVFPFSSSRLCKVRRQDVSALDVIQMLKFLLLGPMWLPHRARSTLSRLFRPR